MHASCAKLPIGVLFYTDEGRDVRYSSELIRKAAAQASRVFVLHPGNLEDSVITRRRGQRTYRFRVAGDALRPGKITSKTDVLALDVESARGILPP